MIALLSLSYSVFSQVDVYQTWLDYDHQKKMNGNWRFFSDYGFRMQTQKNINNWYRFHARPSWGYKPRTLLDYHAGVGFFYTVNQFSLNNMEIRPWQGINLSWPRFRRIRFSNYLRFEERIYFNSQGDAFNFKMRYRLGAQIPLNNTVIVEGTYFIRASVELFFDFFQREVEQRNDRIRIEAGVGYRWKENTTIRALYTLQQIFNNTEYEGVDFGVGFSQLDHVLRITISQRFSYDE